MREPMKEHPIEEARFRGHPLTITRLRELATNRAGAALRGTIKSNNVEVETRTDEWF